MVSNLLTNAAKYTPEGGTIELAAAREGREVVVRVTDTGLGIPPRCWPRCSRCSPRSTAHSSGSQGGLGIGLALVKRLVELHGGTITAQSPGLGEGSTFTVRLPLVEDCEGKRDRERLPRPPAPLTRCRAAACWWLMTTSTGPRAWRRCLKICGHETRTAHSGPEALDAARPFNPDVVFLDIGLPGMNGYEVAKRFRGEPSLSGAVLVALTGWGSEDDKRQSREAGFDFHLTKPVEVTAIENILAGVAKAGEEGTAPI